MFVSVIIFEDQTTDGQMETSEVFRVIHLLFKLYIVMCCDIAHTTSDIWWSYCTRKASTHFDLNGFIKSLINGTIKHVMHEEKKNKRGRKKGPRIIGAWKSGSNIGAVSYQAWPDHVNRVICLMMSNDQALL